jgi:hypothetical protein
MRHINKKTTVQGAIFGGKPKPKPAVLNPPKIGGFKQISSYSVAEIIDLISDGPIDGLVDQNGKLLKKGDIFKGIYLDNTPIQNTENPQANEAEFGSLNISNLYKIITDIWISSDGKFKDEKKISIPAVVTYNVSTAALVYHDASYNAMLASLRGSWSGLTYSFDIPKFYSYSNNQIEIHLDPKEIFTSTIPANTGATERIINRFKSYLIDLANGGTGKRQELAQKNLTAIDKFQQSISSIVPNNFTFFVLSFEGQFFSDEREEELSFDLGNLSSNGGIQTTIIAQPEINSINGKYSGKARGFVVMALPNSKKRHVQKGAEPSTLYYLSQKALLDIRNAEKISVRRSGSLTAGSNGIYNFSNISCQFEDGDEFQSSLSGFDKVRNDYYYDARLYGPFIRLTPIQRIDISTAGGKANFKFGAKALTVTPSNIAASDGSLDQRDRNNFSNWNDSNETRDYDSLSITHNIENPFVKKVSLSINITSLSDTMHVDTSGIQGIEGEKLAAGAKIPTVVYLRVETGKITNGEISNKQTYDYLIAGLSEGGCIIDFGGDYKDPKDSIKESVRIVQQSVASDLLLNDYLNEPFELPELTTEENPTTTKRYIKVVKLSAETNSVLISKDLSINKVTEIIEEKFSYPFSSVAGLKIDSSSFGSIPERSYDCRLKKIKIPNNYFPIEESTSIDKRYVKKASTYVPVSLYIGDWDGEFIEGWTDNPAWILYDILTSKRYGLGGYIDESQINKWELYKIARFCDAVDDDGYFVGVSDGVGGLEPRYSCNIVFKEQTKVYDAINLVANLFRGIVFFGGSEIHFLDDRPRTPIALFSNTNVREGLFNYSNTRKDMQFNTVEVVYLDRFDNYKTKVEYIQDEEDIRKRGVFKTTINTSGVTSRAMARRIGQHIIYQTTKENQGIDFKAGLESLLCRPGDLIIVEDEMKTRSSNYGRILAIDPVQKTLRIDNQFSSGDFTGFITIYTPTGYSTNEELGNVAISNRRRVDQFVITGDLLGNSDLRGLYEFSGYTSGFNNPDLQQQFPLYTGRSTGNTHDIFCYYSTGATGFVFATGRAFQDNNLFDKIITNTGVEYGVDIALPSLTGSNSNYTGFTYNSASGNKRSGPSGAISGAIQWDQQNYPSTRGILPSEIDTYNISQITKIALTGYDNNFDYGSLIYLNSGDPNTALLPIVKEGSPYRIERKNASDQIYKIISIREDNQNEYSITATKYDTGKFETIEKFITQDYLPQTYYTGANTVGSVNVSELPSPIISSFTATDITPSNFKLSGVWSAVVGATGYRAEISNRITSENYIYITGDSSLVATGLSSLGNWDLSLIALGDGSKISSFPSKTGVFVAYSGSQSNIITKPIISNIVIS